MSSNETEFKPLMDDRIFQCEICKFNFKKISSKVTFQTSGNWDGYMYKNSTGYYDILPDMHARKLDLKKINYKKSGWKLKTI